MFSGFPVFTWDKSRVVVSELLSDRGYHWKGRLVSLSTVFEELRFGCLEASLQLSVFLWFILI